MDRPDDDFLLKVVLDGILDEGWHLCDDPQCPVRECKAAFWLTQEGYTITDEYGTLSLTFSGHVLRGLLTTTSCGKEG